MSDWKRKSIWQKRGKDCLVSVEHRIDDDAPDRGPNRWNIYAYVYAEHPLFAKFEGDSIYQAATADMPLHGGCSYLYYHRDKGGAVRSVQVGCDYNHLHDREHTHAEADEFAFYVREGDQLLAWLDAQHAAPVPP